LLKLERKGYSSTAKNKEDRRANTESDDEGSFVASGGTSRSAAVQTGEGMMFSTVQLWRTRWVWEDSRGTGRG